MIQFNIQFKTKFEIFIQSKIHSIIFPKYLIPNFIQEIGKSDSKCQLNINVIFEPSVGAYLGAWGPRVTLITKQVPNVSLFWSKVSIFHIFRSLMCKKSHFTQINFDLFNSSI